MTIAEILTRRLFRFVIDEFDFGQSEKVIILSRKVISTADLIGVGRILAILSQN